MKRSPRTKWLVAGLAVSGAAAATAYALARPRMKRWGATDDEVAAPLPGDDRVADPSYATTYAATIHAPPADVWPWLAQMGYRRGGLYSYDWLDRLFGYLDGPSATEVLPQFQRVQAGDTIPLGRGPSWPVAVAEPERALVLEPIAGVITWAFALVPVGASATRLVTRVRFRPERTLASRVSSEVMGAAAFVMTRRMLLNIKRRSEALARRRAVDVSPRTPARPAEAGA